jgi:sporulation protein YlmC with PRC-barrel domain
MKTRSNNPTPWLAAMVCLTLVLAAKGADAQDAPKGSDSQGNSAQPKLAEQDIWRRWKLAHDAHRTSAESRLSQGAPTQADKASGLLGMEVCNPNGERLGHIKDLVIDWKTEQVSYAVIGAAPRALPGLDEKLLAVPLAALAPSADHQHLVLNAEKSKMQAAQGFDRDHWPSPSNPSWGAAPFWQREADKRAVPEQSAK